MASLFGRIQRFAKSPQGRRALNRASQLAKDPRTRAKINELRGKVSQRRAPQRPTGPSTDPKSSPPGL